MRATTSPIEYRRRTVLGVLLVILLAGLAAVGLLSMYSIGMARADGGSGSSIAVVAAGSGSAVVEAPKAVPPALVDPGADPAGWVESMYDAIKHDGVSVHLLAIALMGLVWLARQKWALGRVKFFTTDRGGVALVFLTSLVAGLAMSLAASNKMPDASGVKAIVVAAFDAIGGFVTIKRVLWPPDKKPDPAPAIPPATV